MVTYIISYTLNQVDKILYHQFLTIKSLPEMAGEGIAPTLEDTYITSTEITEEMEFTSIEGEVMLDEVEQYLTQTYPEQDDYFYTVTNLEFKEKENEIYEERKGNVYLLHLSIRNDYRQEEMDNGEPGGDNSILFEDPDNEQSNMLSI